MTARTSLIVALSFGSAVLAGCNDDRPVVSLEQARQIATQFQGQSLTPPPRTISDIAAILDRHKPDPAKVAAARADADAPVPRNGSPAELARFHFTRAGAAEQIGRTEQWVDDLATAIEAARRANSPALGQYLAAYTKALWRAGKPKEAMAVALESVQQAGSGGGLFNPYFWLAAGSSMLGDIDNSNRWISRGEGLLAEARGWNQGRVYAERGSLWEGMVLTGKALLAADTGHFTESERAFRDAARAWATYALKDPQSTPIAPPVEAEHLMYAYLSRSLIGQGRVVEAEIEARKGLLGLLKVRGRYAPETADAISYLTNVLLEQGRFDEAQSMAAANVEIYESIGHGPDSTRLAQARVDLAAAQLDGGWLSEALSTFERLDSDMAGLAVEIRAKFLTQNLAYGIALDRNGRTDDAIAVYRATAARNLRLLGERDHATAEARGFLAAALARKGDRASALAEFHAAIPVLLASARDRGDGEGDSGRSRRLPTILEAYLEMLANERGEEASAEAFRIADAIRGQSVQRALASSSARAAAGDPALSELVRSEQDARQQVAALQGLLANVLASPPDQQDAAALQKLRAQVDALRSARTRIRDDIERRFPGYVNLIAPAPATIEQARRDLRPGEALVATYVGAVRTFVWAVPAQGPVAFATVPLTRVELGRIVTELRRALDPNAATLGDLPAFDVALANGLYAALLQPVEAGWKNAGSLLVVPHGALGQLPFAVLVTAPTQLQPDREGQPLFASYRSVPFLARTVAITQLPSVASLGSLRALPPPRAGRQPFVGFGDPWFNAQQAAEAVRERQTAHLETRGIRSLVQMRGVALLRRNAPATRTVDSAELALLPRLPDTAEEVKSIAAALNADPAKDVFTGRAANERQARSMDLSDRRVVMFATHGLVPGDLNGLTQPALALSAPAVAGVDGDGLLTLDEILTLRLNADWVVLSACNTAAGDGAGAEAVSGLGRAFFYAGTRALLVSNWPVETTSARALTTDLFRRQARNPTLARAEALRQAEVASIEGPGYVDPASDATVFSYAHPIFWAPFTIVGDGGSGQAGS